MSTTKQIVPESTLVQQRQQGLALIGPLKQSVSSLVVKDNEDYEHASSLLSRIKGAKAHWTERINPIIEPIRAGLDLLYGLRKDIVDPLEDMEAQVKTAMKTFKVEEAKQLRAAEEAKAKQEAELRRLADEKEAKELQARTKPMRDKLAQQRAELEQRLATSKAAEAPAPIKVSGSSTRTVKKWRLSPNSPVAFTELLNYILTNKLEDITALVTIDPAQMDAYFKICKPDVGEWLPGIEVYEDISIAGRR